MSVNGLKCGGGYFPPMHTPSPYSPADLMNWANAGCDLGHRAREALQKECLGLNRLRSSTHLLLTGGCPPLECLANTHHVVAASVFGCTKSIITFEIRGRSFIVIEMPNIPDPLFTNLWLSRECTARIYLLVASRLTNFCSYSVGL